MYKELVLLIGLGFLQPLYAVDLFDDVEPVGVDGTQANEVQGIRDSALSSKERLTSGGNEAEVGAAVQPMVSPPVGGASLKSSQKALNVQPVAEDVDLESEYRLASGDVVTISVYGEPDLSFEAKRLDENGQISYPFLGSVNANNLTAIELESLLTSKLKGDFLVDPKVSVNVKEYRLVYISGAVAEAGAFSYTPGMTVRRLTTLAGGLLDSASIDEISVITDSDSGERVESVTMDTVVNPGDTINVPEFKKVFLSGAVKSPGSIDFRSGMTVRQAISLAGGLTERASESKIYIIQDGKDESQTKNVTMDAPVAPGDSISIGEGFF